MSNADLIARLRAEGKDWRESVGPMPMFDEAADALEAADKQTCGAKDSAPAACAKWLKSGGTKYAPATRS